MIKRTRPMDKLVERYHELLPDEKWFSGNNMNFFGTKLPEKAYSTDGENWLFITSEDNFHKTQRFYTVRHFEWTTAEIWTEGPFNRMSEMDAEEYLNECLGLAPEEEETEE